MNSPFFILNIVRSVDMRSKKIVQTRFIDGSDGHDTAAEFNQVMMDLADLNPKIGRAHV